MKQRGFTLIELIIVIVILGILAVTAAPRFIDIQGDAVGSTVRGVQAALQSASQLTYAKSAIAGEQKNAAGATAASTVAISGVEVRTNFGYPASTVGGGAAADQAQFAAIMDLSVGAGGDFVVVQGAGGTGTAATATTPGSGAFGIHPTGSTPDFTVTAATGASCHVVYTQAGAVGASPAVTAVTGGC